MTKPNKTAEIYEKAIQDADQARQQLAETSQAMLALEDQIVSFMAANEPTDEQETEYAKLAARKAGLTRRVAELERAEARAMTDALIGRLADLRQQGLTEWQKKREIERQGRAIKDECESALASLLPDGLERLKRGHELASQAEELARRLRQDDALTVEDKERVNRIEHEYVNAVPSGTDFFRVAF